jgi:peptidoglycan L-alanyl-D-glutamate endopeptidase CwlK
MINSRNPDDLTPAMREKCLLFIQKCKEAGVDVIITSTYRDFESQDALYAQGRAKPGSKVTNARGGDSYHNYRIAFDFCPIVAGKAMWNDIKTFIKCGEIGEKLGLEYAGDWKSFKEYAHLQEAGHTIEELRKKHAKQS